MFLIILDNAIKFSFENNKVDVLAKNDTIIIRDYGIGINEKICHIFLIDFTKLMVSIIK